MFKRIIKGTVKKCLIVLLLVFCIPAFAVIDQWKLWGGLDITGSLFGNPNLLYDFFPQTRTNLTTDQYDETHTEAGIGYKVLPSVSLWLGYTSVLPGIVPEENDVWQQVMWTLINQDHFTLLSRTRLEERDNINQAQMADTLRQKVSLLFPQTIGKLTPMFYDEVFFNLNHPAWVNHQAISQNRVFVGVRVPVVKHVTFDIGYLNQYVFTNIVNINNNIAYLNLNITT